MNELPSEGRLVRVADKVWIIDAVCINCNKRFTSMRAVSIHLKMTAVHEKQTKLRPKCKITLEQLFVHPNNPGAQ